MRLDNVSAAPAKPERRYGKVRIAGAVHRFGGDAADILQSQMRVLDVTPDFTNDTVIVTGVSRWFRDVREGDEAPFYELVVRGNGFEFNRMGVPF